MILGVIQARLNSSRLPGKVLLPLAGTTVLEHLVKRVRIMTRLDAVVAVIPFQDVRLAEAFAELGVPCLVGPEDDVLSRFTRALTLVPASHVVRITADNPLTDPWLADQLIEQHLAKDADYSVAAGIPLGMGVEVVRAEALRALSGLRLEPRHREHVTLYIRERPDEYRLWTWRYGPSSVADARLTLDELADALLLERIFSEEARSAKTFGLADVERVLRTHPEWLRLNEGVRQRFV